MIFRIFFEKYIISKKYQRIFSWIFTQGLKTNYKLFENSLFQRFPGNNIEKKAGFSGMLPKIYENYLINIRNFRLKVNLI